MRFVMAAAAAILLASGAQASEINGEWLRSDGVSKVRFAPCGAAVCAVVSWLKDPNGKGKLGQKVFYDLTPNGPASWAGKAFNPEDGKEYSAKVSLEGATLTTAGCVMGGLFCKSFTWSRAP